MSPVVKYAGRDETAPSGWTVRFDLVDDDRVVGKYWGSFQVHSWDDDIDVDAPGFWGSAAYLSGHLIEQGQFKKSTSELNLVAREVADHARQANPKQPEPNVGDVCWRM